MSNRILISSFPLGVECLVKFRGKDTIYEGVFKRMVTKNRVIFFGNSITILAKPPSKWRSPNEVSTIIIKETNKRWVFPRL